MKKHYFVYNILLLLSITFVAQAQSFEGIIRMVKETPTDTFYYTFYVKDNLVRVDELDVKTQVEEYTVFDSNNRTAKVVSATENIYSRLSLNPYQKKANANYEITKTPNTMNIHGYDCVQWRVRSDKENTQVTYWVAKGEFDFFLEYMKMSNRQEFISSYFLLFDNAEGVLPLLWEERSYLREFRQRYKVLEIIATNITPDVFEIPTHYQTINY